MALLEKTSSERTVKKIVGLIAKGELTSQFKDRLLNDRKLSGAVMEVLLAEKVQQTTNQACAEFMGMGLLTDGTLFANVMVEHVKGKKGGIKMGFEITDDEGKPRTPKWKRPKMGF